MTIAYSREHANKSTRLLYHFKPLNPLNSSLSVLLWNNFTEVSTASSALPSVANTDTHTYSVLKRLLVEKTTLF